MSRLVVETERLRLFEFSDGSGADAAFMLRLLNDEEFIRGIRDEGVRTLDQATQFLRERPMQAYAKHGHGLYRVEEKSSGLSIGSCGLLRRDELDAPDLGYAFLPEGRGQGYVVEAARAVLDYARDVLGLQRVLAIVDPSNLASIKVLQKLRFDCVKLLQLSHKDIELKLFETNLFEAEAGR